MSAYKPVSVVEVTLWDKSVGVLATDPSSGYIAFEYDPKFARTGWQPSPLLLPVQPGASVFTALPVETFHRLPAFIADSLPDRFGNTLIDAWMARHGLSANDFSVLDRLAYVGRRAMGALEFAPALKTEFDAGVIEAKAIVEAARRAFSLDKDALAAQNDAAMAQLIRIGTSAGGAKAKAVVGFNPDSGELVSGQLELSEGFEPWLLKIDTGSKPYGCMEYAYHLMAVDCGIAMSECRLLEVAGKQHFMTRRFDRAQDGSKLHMQSLCALAAMDFNQMRTYDYAQLFDVAVRLGLGRQTLDQLFSRMLFNVCMANNDDHPKNHSFLMDRSGAWSLAPAYDVMFACNPRSKWTACHAMSINGSFADISRKDCIALGRRFGISSIEERIDRTIEVALRWPDYARRAGVDERTIADVGSVTASCVDSVRE